MPLLCKRSGNPNDFSLEVGRSLVSRLPYAFWDLRICYVLNHLRLFERRSDVTLARRSQGTPCQSLLSLSLSLVLSCLSRIPSARRARFNALMPLYAPAPCRSRAARATADTACKFTDFVNSKMTLLGIFD